MEIDTVKLDQLVNANGKSRGFTYSHKPIASPEHYAVPTDATVNARNLHAIRDANARGFAVSASADTLAQADALADLGVPVVTVLPTNHVGNTTTPAGRKVVQCPATKEASKLKCSDCGLCAVQNRAIVGFPAHGVGKSRYNAMLAD